MQDLLNSHPSLLRQAGELIEAWWLEPASGPTNPEFPVLKLDVECAPPLGGIDVGDALCVHSVRMGFC